MPRNSATCDENCSPLAKGAARSDGGREAPGGCPFGLPKPIQDNPLKALPSLPLYLGGFSREYFMPRCGATNIQQRRSLMNKYLAEFVGTFLLTLAVSVCLATKFPVPTAVVAALTLGVSVYVFGAISGTHINPGITLGILSVGRISPKDAALYVVSQLAGAGLAIVISGGLVTRAALTASNTGPVFLAEILGTFCLATGVASVVFGKAPAPAAGLTIGGALLLGLSVASSGSNGVLNPAVAVGIGSISIAYLIAPLVGAVMAFQLYRFLAIERELPQDYPEPKPQARGRAGGVS